MEEKTIKSNEFIDVLRRMKGDELFDFFLYSCEEGHLELCQLCLDAGLDINTHESFRERTILTLLVDNGKFTKKVADWLIDKGADINATDIADFSPLSIACNHGNFNIVKYFIDKGAKINCRYNSDLYYAITGGVLGCRNTPGQNRLKTVRFLLEKGAKLDSADIKEIKELMEDEDLKGLMSPGIRSIVSSYLS